MKTQMYDFHKDHGNLVEFGGFSMPVWYKGIISECSAVRSAAGIFDVSHMGRVYVKGVEAEHFLNYVTTNDVDTLELTEGHYSLLCNPKGGIVDDITVFKLEPNHFLVVYNAGNRAKDFSWLMENAKKFKVEVQDVSERVAMFALQGPRAVEILETLSGLKLSDIGRFNIGGGKIAGEDCSFTRTGYTGEDGFEIYVHNAPIDDPAKAHKVWNAIIDAGKSSGLQPCGLGARDALRLEAGMCLYGNDIDYETTPLEAKLGFAVKLDKPDFVGKAALSKQKAEGLRRSRVGIKLLEKGIPRSGQEISKDGQNIGKVTSGTYSPLLKFGIAMGYVKSEHAGEGTEVQVKIRERLVKAVVVKLPFYQRKGSDKIIYMGKEMSLNEAVEKGMVAKMPM